MKQKTKTILLGTVVLGLLVGIVLAARWYQQEYQLAVSTSFVMDTVVEQKLYGRNSQQAVAEIDDPAQAAPALAAKLAILRSGKS